MLRPRRNRDDENAYVSLDDDSSDVSGLHGDYGELSADEYSSNRYFEDHDGSSSSYRGSSYLQEDQGPSATEKATARAKELTASFQAGASKFFQSTKDWIKEKAEQANQATSSSENEHMHRMPLFSNDHGGLQSQQVRSNDGHGQSRQSRSGRGERSRRNEREIDPARLLVQEQVPLALGKVVSGDLDPSRPETRALYRSLPVYVPHGVSKGQEFVVALPTGEARLVAVPANMEAGERVTIAYKGYIHDGFGVEYVDEEDEDILNETTAVPDGGPKDSSKPRSEHVRKSPDERLIDLYRKHNPEERDALLERGEDGFGIQVYDGEFGVHVYHAVFVGVQTMIAADDVIVSVNGEAVVCRKDFERILATVEVGGYISLGILRKSPPPVQRCPAGHPLLDVGPRDPLPLGSVCNRCSRRLFDVAKVHRCTECDWALCDECYQGTFEAMNSGVNANRGAPEWADRYEESFGAKLSFSTFDKGTKLRIYWHTTGEWWLGEVSSYQPGRGHEIVYEEGSGPNKQMSKQTIPDISLYTYKVLRPKKEDSKQNLDQMQQKGQEAAKEQEEDLLASGGESFMLNDDERSLLESIEKDLGSGIEEDLSSTSPSAVGTVENDSGAKSTQQHQQDGSLL